MPVILRKLKITKVDLCREGANPDADIMIYKSNDQPIAPQISKENTPVSKLNKIDLTKATPEQVLEYAKALETTVDAHEAELAKAFPPKKGKGKAKPGTDDNDADDIAKDDDGDVTMSKTLEALQATVAAQTEELKKANVRAENAEKIAKANADAAELITFEKSVATDMPNVPGTVTEVAKMLQQAKATLTADAYTTLEKALKAGSAALAKASTEVGSSKSAVVGTAEQEFFKAADELVTKGVCKTRPEAVVQINKTRTDLAEAYRVEREARIRK